MWRTKANSYQDDDEKNIIDIDMNIDVEKERKWMNEKNVPVFFF